mmetsp:Transcript_6396/g.9231  ORF Transcript_6396/g.9231 Transcript_6396/m.9231 type:complete len:100 (-) Transcript_6396:1016-1315(-)
MEENQNQHTTSAPADDAGDANQGNLIGIIHQNAQSFPDQVFLSWVNNKCNVENTITYAQLWQQTALVVEMLQRNGIKAGDRVMISYPFGLEFLAGVSST